MDHVPASLDDVLITAELARRPTRSPDYEAEALALTALAEAMAASPQAILQNLVETALDLCRADSAGITILESGGAQDTLRWKAITGLLASHVGKGMPRESSPSGVVLDRDTLLLFSYPQRHFDYGMPVDMPIVEALLVPFHSEGVPVGTLWVIAHTPSRQFDAEDQRLLTSLSRFAAVAYQMKTALVMTDAGLKAKAHEVRQILDTSATGITRCSRDLRFLSANAAIGKLVGLPVEQIIGRPMVDVMGVKAFEVIRPYVERVLRGERVEYEEEFPYAPGWTKLMHVVYTPWIDNEGHVAGWVASVSDITDLKRTTKALRESEERLRLAMSSGTIGIWDWCLSTGHLAWSPELCEILGMEAGVKRTYEDFKSRVHPDDLAAMESERDAAIRNRAQFDLEFRIIRPSGEIRWLSARGRGFYDENGRVVRVVGNNIDITERVQAKEALRERELRLQLALDASGAASWMRDARTGHIDWDDRFRKLYGFTAEEPASLEAWLNRIHEEDRQQVLELVDQIRHTTTHDTFDVMFRIVRPNETVRWIQSVGQAHRDADGQLTQLSGLELDITDRRRAEEVLQARHDEERERTLQQQAEEVLRRSHAELEQSHAELERRTLQLSRLASQLTLAEQHAREELARTLHDGLQQQLFTAALALELAAKGDSEAGQRDLFQKARAEIKEALEATRTLSLSLFPPILHTGGLPVALSWLAKRTQEQYGVVVSVTADPQANPAASDTRILLFEAVRELLFNAVKHARVARVDINLAVGPDDTIHVQVSDEGVGFDPDVIFSRGDQHQLGLGLFSIRERLALLGGWLDIQSAPGKGARFRLTLPRTDLRRLATDGGNAQHGVTGWRNRHPAAGGATNLLRILIADDHAVVRAGLREMLGERPEFQVVGEAANGIEAISQVKVLQPDVVTMDVSMPQMNGIEATREIHRTLPHIQIVGLSTFSDEATELSMREAGAHAYFSKTESSHRLIDYLLSIVPQAKAASAD
jgi:PAS domain S-box-containing protein